MKKIIVIGCPGSGKTTFATKLGSLLHIPVHHLDKHFWREHMTPTPHPEFKKVQDGLMQGDQWILDGNFHRNIENRLINADTVILFDVPKRVCLYRICKRFFLHMGTIRHDMGGQNKEKFKNVRELIKYVVHFSTSDLYTLVKPLEHSKKIFIFHSSKDVSDFLNSVQRD